MNILPVLLLACPQVKISNLPPGGYLNVRSGDDTTFPVIDYVRQGDTLETNGPKTPNNWFHVKHNGKTGYVSGKYAECQNNEKRYAWTVPGGYVCQAFGKKISYQTCGFHTGLDICAKNGDDILAMASGVVVHVGPLWYDAPGTGRGPYSIVVDHGNGFYSTYGHNSKTIVKVGDNIVAGQKIGEIGNLGFSYGPHLHLEVLENAKWSGDWRRPFVDACSKYKDPNRGY